MSVDPSSRGVSLADPQTWNRYEYVESNPVRFIDPTGNTVAMAGDSDPDAKRLFINESSQAVGLPISEDASGNLVRAQGPPTQDHAAATAAFDKAASPETPMFTITATKDGHYMIGDRFENFSQTNPQVNPLHLAAFPGAPPSGHPEATTRGELIAHIFAEYAEGSILGGFNANTYPASHKEGTKAQDAHRLGLGQVGRVSGEAGGFNPDGSGRATINYSSGASTTIQTNSDGVIDAVAFR